MSLASAKSFMVVQQTRLRDVASVIRGVSFGKSDASQDDGPNLIPLLRAGNISDSLDTDHDLVWVPKNRVSKEQFLKEGDIAICMSSGSREIVGKSALLDKPWTGSVGAFCAVIRTDPSACIPEYLAFFLKSSAFRTWTKASEGINIKNIRKSELENFSVPIPSIQEQRRIVDILKRADGIRRLRKQAIQTARELIPALFVNLFGDPAKNPKGWPVVACGELIVDGPQNGLYKPSSAYGDGTPILRIDGFYDGAVSDWTSLRRLRISDQERARYRLREGDIVINRVNSPEYLGKSTLITGLLEETVFESNMMRFAVDTARILPAYFIRYLQTSYVKSQILAGAKHAINQSSINQQDVKSLQIVTPPLAMQLKYVEIIRNVNKIEVQQEVAADTSGSVFASLLHRAFCGEL